MQGQRCVSPCLLLRISGDNYDLRTATCFADVVECCTIDV
eukprot:COSAG05_NODE_1878_length_3911_cov_62.469576_6_plen_40_part_00